MWYLMRGATRYTHRQRGDPTIIKTRRIHIPLTLDLRHSLLRLEEEVFPLERGIAHVVHCLQHSLLSQPQHYEESFSTYSCTIITHNNLIWKRIHWYLKEEVRLRTQIIIKCFNVWVARWSKNLKARMWKQTQGDGNVTWSCSKLARCRLLDQL